MNWYDLDELLPKAELPEVSRRLGMDVERRGVNLVTRCPFHEDTRPSLVLYPSDRSNPSHFHCFSCNAHGYAVDLVKKVQGVEFNSAIEWLARSLGIAPKRNKARRVATESTEEGALTFARRVFDGQHDEARFFDWCQRRLFDRDFLFGLGLRYLPAGSALVRALQSKSFGQQQELIDGLLSAGLLTRLRPETKIVAQGSLDLSEQFRDYFNDGRVLIPIRSATSELLGFAGRHAPTMEQSRAPAKYLLTPGFRKAEVLFNANLAKRILHETIRTGGHHPVLYVVEGFLDALRLSELNLPAVAVMGTSLSEKQREGILAMVKAIDLPGGEYLRLRIFFDRDEAGFNGASRVARQLLGFPAVATEWVGFGNQDNAPSGKDPDSILSLLSREEANARLDQHAFPAIGVLIAANLGYKDATPLLGNDRWSEISRYPRERALLQAARIVRAVSHDIVDWAQRLDSLAEPRPRWATELLELLRPRSQAHLIENRSRLFEGAFLKGQEARLNHARMLAEHGARRGELPCDEETWRVLDRNAQLFNALALDRLRQPAWQQVAPCDAVHLPRKLSGENKVLNDPRRKVMPHTADLHLQQFLMAELLTERYDFSHEGPRSFSDCIPAVRWFGTEREVRVTGYVGEGEPNPALFDDERGEHDEVALSFAYQIDMDVLEGRRKPSDQGMFRPYMECWRDYMASLARQARAIGSHVHVLRLDAKRYYDSIQRYVVRDRLLGPIEQALTIGGAEDLLGLFNLENSNAQDAAKHVVDLICGSLFEHHYRHPDDGSTRRSGEVTGIPQGPVISAWVGTIAMFPVDAAARTFLRRPDQRRPDDPSRPRVGYARYVDDIVLLADSEAQLNALRETVQSAAARLALTLVRKGETVAPGSPELVMRQLNEGRVLAASVPAWEPPMIGDGETGWDMVSDEVGPMDRQSALHLLRHPNLLDDPATVHEKVRDAMRASDLRPSDLGKCARALWWQVATQVLENEGATGAYAWDELWQAYHQRWHTVSAGHGWALPFQRRGYDILFAVEGLDMLMDFSISMEKGRTQEWIKIHRKALEILARTILRTNDLLQNIPLPQNRSHIRSRIRKVQWKALRRVPSVQINLPDVDPQISTHPTLTDWLCQAAILLNRYDPGVEPRQHPLDRLPRHFDPTSCRGPSGIKTACEYLKPRSEGAEVVSNTPEPDASRMALQFLAANTAESKTHSRWEILRQYPKLIGNGLNGLQQLDVLPPLPVHGAGMLAYIRSSESSEIRFLAFTSGPSAEPLKYVVGATVTDGVARPVEPLALHWLPQEEPAPNIYRYRGKDTFGLAFDTLQPANRPRFAAELYELLHAIQRQGASDGTERVIVMAHLAHEHRATNITEVAECSWYLVSEPVASSHLGVSAWVRDTRGGLRSVSVPGGDYTALWRLGCAVSDALEMAFDIPGEMSAPDEDEEELTHPHQIEDYLLRQQLGKLRGTWISDAQVQDRGDDGLPRTIRRALDILRDFDPSLDQSTQVRMVLYSETETRSMAMRLQRKGPSDLGGRMHLLPALVLQRLPLSVLGCLPLPAEQETSALRTDLVLLLGLAASLSVGNQNSSSAEAVQGGTDLGPAHALHIGVALAAAGVALRGLVASAWGVARHRVLALPEHLPVPAGWNPPDAERQDPQRDYDIMRDGLRNDDWSRLQESTPWQWMLALLGVLHGMAPHVLVAHGDNPLCAVYEHLRHWQFASPEQAAVQRWSWPYDDLPAYDLGAWSKLLKDLPRATQFFDKNLGLVVRQVEAPVFRRHRDDSGFTDSAGQQWTLAKLQYSGMGSGDSVARVQRGSRRLATWTEVRRRADDELLSVHTLDDKLGRWWHGQNSAIAEPAVNVGKPLPSAVDQSTVEKSTAALGEQIDRLHASPLASGNVVDLQYHSDKSVAVSSVIDSTRRDVRESQLASWSDRGDLKSPSHMRVALLQWCIDESYSHPIAEVGLMGMGMPERERVLMREALVKDSAMANVEKTAVRGNEQNWRDANTQSISSWPEHRRRRLLERALGVCKQLKVDLLVLPEVSVRRETVNWLEGELRRQHSGLAVLAGTYRHFGQPVDDRGGKPKGGGDVHPLMAPLTLLWRPDEELSKALFGENTAQTLRFWRGKKYRAVAANELFYPDWKALAPLFRTDPLLEQLFNLNLPPERQTAFVKAVVEQMPPLRYCMELICSELFLLTSPANAGPLRQEVAAMLKRFPGGPSAKAEEIVAADHQAVGEFLSVLQEHHKTRRTVLLVPAATKRSNDYWHAGQASVLASGTATVFCNAAKSVIACGGSCFIGIDSATKPHGLQAGLIETLTPYHGWRKGILTARSDGALSDADQALVVADIDPVHVVTGKPRPQLLPEPMALVAYLPVVELLDQETSKIALYESLSKVLPEQINAAKKQDVLTALATVATSPHSPKNVRPENFWSKFHSLRQAQKLDGSELDSFVKLFGDPKAIRERLLTWDRDRHQQPHPVYGPLNREPAWFDFLDVDLTLREGQQLPSIAVPSWNPETEAPASGDGEKTAISDD